MPIPAEHYARTGVRELLDAAARGHVPVDHRLLHAVLDNPRRAVQGILEFTRRDWDQDRVDLAEDIILMARHLASPSLLPFLIERVQAEPADVADELVEAISIHPEAALDPLLAAFDATEPGAPSEIPFLLASLGIEDERIRTRLAQLTDTDPEESAFCLEIYESDRGERREAEPFDIWELYPKFDDPPFDLLPETDLIEFLDSSSPELRAAAAASVSTLPETSENLAARLVRLACDDAEPSVRGAAWQSLAQLSDDDELREQMLERLADSSTPAAERAGLVIGLAMIANDDRVRAAVMDLYKAVETRAAALEAIWRSKDRSFESYVLRHLDDPDPDLRHHAILGAGHLELKGALKRLEECFSDPEFRPTALMAYALATPVKVSPAYMERVFRKIEELASGLSTSEADLVRQALDHRLELHGLEPMFESDSE